jgi:CII-binding regulator of phage lambda lysogenization HflD
MQINLSFLSTLSLYFNLLLLESKCIEQEKEIKEKDERLSLLEKSIEHKSTQVTSLESEIEWLLCNLCSLLTIWPHHR